MSTKRANRSLHCLLLLTAFFSLFIFCQPALASPEEVDHVNRQIWSRGAKWWAAETSVSALPPDLRLKRVGLLSSAVPAYAENAAPLLAPSGQTLAGSLNYVNYDYVTDVKDQGNCGSCWAFATTAALESQVAKATGAKLDLSEQVLVSCSGAGDCNGGYIDTASTYLKNVGLPLEECFPYTETNNYCANASCPYWQSDTHKITGWQQVSATVTALKDALSSYGPLAVSMEVYTDFFAYWGGIYSRVYGTYEGGHAVLLVGYDDSLQCFIVKNSWGTDWGEDGFFRIAYSQMSGVVRFGQYSYAYTGYQHNATPCSYSLSATSGSVPVAGGTLTVNVTAGSGCYWTAKSNVNWITVTSGASGIGSGQVRLSIALTGAPRTGTVTIAGKTYTVNQSGSSSSATTYGKLVWASSSWLQTLWGLDASDNYTGTTNYGPYTGWSVVNYSRTLDGQARVLWTNGSRLAKVFMYGPSGTDTGNKLFGPYTGWKPISYQRCEDGTARLLWLHTSGLAALWKLDATETIVTHTGLFGPYSGWKPVNYQRLSNGTGRFLWLHTSGLTVLWMLDTAERIVTDQRSYGPFQGWKVLSYKKFPDGKARILWTNSSGLANIWILDPTETTPVGGRLYGPYPGKTPVSYE